MDWFNIYTQYIKRNVGDENLQRYLIIWDDRYPSMVRRCLAMSLKEKLDALPTPEDKVDLKALFEGIKNLMPSISNIEAKTENIHRIFNKVDEVPTKKLTAKQQRDKNLKDAKEQEKALILKRINQN